MIQDLTGLGSLVMEFQAILLQVVGNIYWILAVALFAATRMGLTLLWWGEYRCMSRQRLQP